ncbi:hypothetical protein OAS95_01630 [Pelagibacteraceae bacterium]|nr:hypothetical protein [Pelagibacteraceae bacterium]
MKKILIVVSLTIILNGCANSLAFLGPASSVAGGGNIAQSAVSSAISYGVKKQTGMTPSEHAIAYVKKHNPENKKEKCIESINITNSEACAALKENISKTTKKIAEVKNSIFDKSKIEDLAKKSGLVRR